MLRFHIHRPQALAAFIALMIALFTLAPLAEAAACGPEISGPAVMADASLVVANEAPSEADGCCTPAYGCVHGYCHAPASLPPAYADVSRSIVATVPNSTPTTRSPESTAPDGLIRPPRA